MATDGPRSYTDAQRKAALALHVEHGPTEAARQTGIPDATIKSWARRRGVRTASRDHPMREAVAVAELSWARRRARLTDDTGTAAAEILERLRSARTALEAHRLAMTLGILIEKCQLLDGSATARLEVSDEARRARVGELRDELASRRESKPAVSA